jgi:hypothetical protein
MAATGVAFGLLSFVPVTGSLVWVLGALGGAAFFGIYTSALAILGQEHNGAMLVAGASAFSLAYAFGGVVGPSITGGLLDLVPGTTFAPVALLGFCGALLLIWRR